MGRIGIRVLVAGIILVTGVVAAGRYLSGPPQASDQSSSIAFSVRSGDSLRSIAAQLANVGLVRSDLMLRVLARVRGADSQIRAGHYSLSTSLRAGQLLTLLLAGHQEHVSITIPEGWTGRRIGERLEEHGITTSAEFSQAIADPMLIGEYGIQAQTMEGYLFPDTYHFPRDYPAVDVVRHMANNFFRQLAVLQPDFERIEPDELHGTIILASIVEREYQRPEEAALIASVFVNRLSVDIGLQSCATIAYVLTEIQGKQHPEVITYKDLQVESAFNTYMWHGLPPAPISNPGAIALQAAFFPVDSNYWYFVLKDPETGEHYFSQDLDEHNDAKFFYLKGVTS